MTLRQDTHGGSRQGKSPNIYRDFEGSHSHARFKRYYFGENGDGEGAILGDAFECVYNYLTKSLEIYDDQREDKADHCRKRGTGFNFRRLVSYKARILSHNVADVWSVPTEASFA